jgi:hypothetical protein
MKNGERWPRSASSKVSDEPTATSRGW